MSEESDVELSKEQQLEAARKKFAELKKKKAKKTKNKKKEDDESKEEESKDTDDVEEAKDAEEHKDTEEVKDAEEPKVTVEIEETDASKEIEEPKATEDSKDSETDVKDEVSISEPSSKDTNTNDDLEQKVKSLEETIDQQKSTISRLRDENTDLKLSKMDSDDIINELRGQIASLKSSAGAAAAAAASSATFIPVAPKPAKAIITTNEFASVSKQNLDLEATSDFRESLLLWKGWQVDMTSWNTGLAQMVSL